MNKLALPFIGVLFVLASVRVVLQIIQRGWHPLIVAFLAIGVALSIILIVMIPFIRCYMWDRFWQGRFKAINRCPACEYDMKGRMPEADGCSICPECGGAWRVPSTSPVAISLAQRGK